MTLPILRSANQPIRRGENVRDTALSTFRPWRGFDEVDRWFDEFMGRSFGISPLNQDAATPAIDLYESSDEVRLFAYVPGAKSDGFEISVAKNVLTLRGERIPLLEGEGWQAYGSGIARAQGRFEASYALPADVMAENATATYHAGVLEVHLPKAEQARVKTVKVNVENR